MTAVITLKDIAAELQNKVDEIDALLSDIYAVVKRGMIEKFTAAGGCTHCRGYHVVRGHEWHSERYACTHCSASDAERTGICPAEDSKYDPGLLYHFNDDIVLNSVLFKTMADVVLAERADYRTILNDVEAHAHPRWVADITGCEVLVVKGTKVPRGTVGRVDFVNVDNSMYGTVLSITTAGGKTYRYVALKNCEIVYDPKRHKFA